VPEFAFECTGAYPDKGAAAPTISLQLHIEESTGVPVHALALRTQIRIEPLRRRYDDTEAAAMQDLFGERARWGSTLKPLQLGFVNQMVPTFTDRTDVEIALTCSYDFDVAANKYLYALDEGEVPLLLLFSGTVFTAEGNGFSVSLVPWDREARYRLPVPVWKETMELHFPGTAWLRVGSLAFEALHEYRTAQQLTSWDDAIERLLKAAEQ
jgi:hypothetical protein